MNSTDSDDPIDLFQKWYSEALKTEPSDATAVALATATNDGVPSVRMVLLKGLDERGFVFYTNLESRKALEIKDNPVAALCFHWKSQRRQVRVEGTVSEIDGAEADAYFQSRPRTARIGAWASDQSRPMAGRFDLEKRVASVTAKYNVGDIPRPDFWSGYCIYPGRIEFWENREFRLHDRIVYTRSGDGWVNGRLYP